MIMMGKSIRQIWVKVPSRRLENPRQRCLLILLGLDMSISTTRIDKAKTQISCAVTAHLISAFVFATQIVQSLFLSNPIFQASTFF